MNRPCRRSKRHLAYRTAAVSAAAGGLGFGVGLRLRLGLGLRLRLGLGLQVWELYGSRLRRSSASPAVSFVL